jgi:hypothetical protein
MGFVSPPWSIATAAGPALPRTEVRGFAAPNIPSSVSLARLPGFAAAEVCPMGLSAAANAHAPLPTDHLGVFNVKDQLD